MINDIDPHDFWLNQVLDECQATLMKLQHKYGKSELSLEKLVLSVKFQ